MKKIFCLVICFLMVFSVVRVANNREPLQLRSFVNALSDISFDSEGFVDAFEKITSFAQGARPAKFTNPFSAFDDVDGVIDAVLAIGRMFVDLGKSIVLLGEWTVYAISLLIIGIILPVWELVLLIVNFIVSLFKTLLLLFGFIPSVA